MRFTSALEALRTFNAKQEEITLLEAEELFTEGRNLEVQAVLDTLPESSVKTVRAFLFATPTS